MVSSPCGTAKGAEETQVTSWPCAHDSGTARRRVMKRNATRKKKIPANSPGHHTQAKRSGNILFTRLLLLTAEPGRRRPRHLTESRGKRAAFAETDIKAYLRHRPFA